MGHQKGNKGGARSNGRPQSRRRGYIPEPGEVRSIENCQVGYYQEHIENPRHRGRGRDKSKPAFNFTHTSCIMAIRNYVERMQGPKRKRKKTKISAQENAEMLIGSLKNDIQAISKYEEEVARNPSKPPASDPFFVLSAMMCKINKLENILLAQPDCKEQLAKRKEMIMMARCIKKTLMDQAHCDHQIMQDKQRKMVCLVKSLDLFEKDIRHATRGIKRLCCPKPSANHVAINTNPMDRERSRSQYLEMAKRLSRSNSPKSSSNIVKEQSSTIAKEQSVNIAKEPPSKKSLTPKPAFVPEPTGGSLANDLCAELKSELCGDGRRFDITGLKLVYTKSHVQKDSCGGETEEIKDKLSCEVNEEEECQIQIIKDGAQTSSEECDPAIRERMNHLSKIWMESARQLIDACTRC